MHGFLLGAERLVKARFGETGWARALTAGLPGKILLGLVTYFFVNLTWVFFRATDFHTAHLLILSMFGIVRDGAQVLPTLAVVKVVVVVAALVVTHWTHRSIPVEAAAERLPGWAHGLVWGGMLILIILSQGSDNAFIYFQF